MDWADEMSDEELPPEAAKPKPVPPKAPPKATVKPELVHPNPVRANQAGGGATALFPRATGGIGSGATGYKSAMGSGSKGGDGSRGGNRNRKKDGGRRGGSGYADRDRDRNAGGKFNEAGKGNGGDAVVRSKGPGACANPRCNFKIHSNPPHFFKPMDLPFCCSLCRMSNGNKHGGKCERVVYIPAKKLEISSDSSTAPKATGSATDSNSAPREETAVPAEAETVSVAPKEVEEQIIRKANDLNINDTVE